MRARNIKPGFFMNEELSECVAESRLLFIGLWCYADKRGKFKWSPKKIKAAIFPYDHGLDIEPCLNELISKQLIVRYEVAGLVCGMIPNFEIHQRPHHNEVESTLPSIGDLEIKDTEKFTGWNTLREVVFKRDGRICNFCRSTNDLFIDHITATCRGGKNELSNLQVLCRGCNRRKDGWEEEGLSIDEMKRRTKAESHNNQGCKSKQPETQALRPDILNPDILILGCSDSNNPPIPPCEEITPEKPKRKKRISELSKSQLESFEKFWAVWPKHVAQADAEKAWMKISPTNGQVEIICHAVEKWKKSPKWQENNGEFIPYPATWLNGKRWRDEIKTTNTQPEYKSRIIKSGDNSIFADPE